MATGWTAHFVAWTIQLVNDIVAERRSVAERMTAVLKKDEALAASPAPVTLGQRVQDVLRRKAIERERKARDLETWRSLMRLRDRATELQVGSSGRPWGVLAGGMPKGGRHPICLESALQKVSASSCAHVRAAAEDLTDRLPSIRVAAELREDFDLAVVEDEILSLVTMLEGDLPARRRLLHYLPVHRRPTPRSLDELKCGGPPATLMAFLDDGPFQVEKFIYLGDIVVAECLRGKGLGTAILAELCNFADLHGLPIQGTLEPGPKRPREDVPPLARWYHSRGFRQGGRDPEQWSRGAIIRREPAPAPG